MCFHFVWIFKPDFGIMCLYLVDAVVLVDGTGEVGLVELTLIENISSYKKKDKQDKKNNLERKHINIDNFLEQAKQAGRSRAT